MRLTAKVLIWRYREEKSFAAIKELLGKPISTVRNHHSRGIFELLQFFQKEGEKMAERPGKNDG